MAAYYPSSNNQQSHGFATPYFHSQKLDSYGELPRLPDHTMYLNQTSLNESCPKLISGCSQSPQNCEAVLNVGHKNEVVFAPLMRDSVGLSIVEQLNMTEDVQDSEQDLHYKGLSLSLGADFISSEKLPRVQYHFDNQDPLQLVNFLNRDSGKAGSQRDESKTNEFPSSGFARGTEDIINFGDFSNPEISSEMQYAQNLHESSGVGYSVSNPNYLKGVQQLLDEVVNVFEALKKPRAQDPGQVDGRVGSDINIKYDYGFPSVAGISSGHPDITTNSSGEPPNAEQLDQNSKLTKLLSLLKEVDTKYKQYRHQMRILESSFQMMAGCGAAKRYTALAFQTISCQFRCLRDGINRQIQECRQSLGEQVDEPKSPVLPRLSYVDKHLRQRRTLQQLGIMRHTWRPQKGLPGSSVSVLRAWLFEHFLNPYPKDSEKLMLAGKAGLTRSQVANWFINARVRLWKPMVEDMYKEEFGDSEANINEEPKESVMPRATRSDHLGNSSDLKADTHCNQNNNTYTTRLNVNNGSQGDGSVASGVITLHSDNWLGVDERYSFSQKYITSIQIDEGSLKPIATPYDLSDFGDFTVGNQVSHFAMQC